MRDTIPQHDFISELILHVAVGDYNNYDLKTVLENNIIAPRNWEIPLLQSLEAILDPYPNDGILCIEPLEEDERDELLSVISDISIDSPEIHNILYLNTVHQTLTDIIINSGEF